MQLLSKFNKEIHFLCVVDIYSKYAWVVPFKDKDITINNTFENVLDESDSKPSKI